MQQTTVPQTSYALLFWWITQATGPIGKKAPMPPETATSIPFTGAQTGNGNGGAAELPLSYRRQYRKWNRWRYILSYMAWQPTADPSGGMAGNGNGGAVMTA